MKYLIGLLIFSNTLYAFETRYIAQSPTALLMGGAYTAIADDEYTLFYNPATLARHDGFSFNPVNIELMGTNALKDQDRFNDLGSDPADVSDAILDYPIFLGMGYNPGLKLEGFGISAIVNYQTKFHLQNQVNPMLDVDHRYDRGFIMGYGHAYKGNFSKEGGGEHLAWGVSTKYLQREGIYGSYNLAGTSLLGALNNDTAEEILEDLGQVRGSGWGFDIGFEYAKSYGSSQLLLGLALIDVYTILHTDSNEQDLEVAPQPYRATFGSAFRTSIAPGLNFTVSLDVDHLEKQMEFMRRLKLGTEIGLTPAVSLYGGINATDNYSYGLKLSTGLIKLFAGFYTVETGEKLLQQESNRFVIYLSMFDFTFMP